MAMATGERADREPKRAGLEAVEPPARSRVRSPGEGQVQGRSPLKLKAFCPFYDFHTKSGLKLRIKMKTCSCVYGADCFAEPRPALSFGHWSSFGQFWTELPKIRNRTQEPASGVPLIMMMIRVLCFALWS